MHNIGDTFEDQISFTEEDVLTFARLVGDFNPIHIDKDYEFQSEYGRNIVHGNLAGSAFSKVFSTTFPGPGTILIQKDITFLRPIFVEEPYYMHFKLSSVDYKTHTAVIKSVLKNEHGNKCIYCINKLKNQSVFSEK